MLLTECYKSTGDNTKRRSLCVIDTAKNFLNSGKYHSKKEKCEVSFCLILSLRGYENRRSLNRVKTSSRVFFGIEKENHL